MPVLQTEFSEGVGAFSPDGHWIGYFSDESGRFEVYVRSFTEGGAGVKPLSMLYWSHWRNRESSA